MHSAIEQFRENMQRVKSLGGLTRALGSMTTSAIDTSDILRAQYVLAVSALDHYVHETTRLGMLEAFDGDRVAPPAYLRFRISLDCLGTGKVVSRSDVDTEIRTQHGFVSFQHPDSVADAIRLVSDIKLWETVATKMSSNSTAIRERLRLIVDRRNKIAHEADLDPTYPKARWPISASDVDQVVNFLIELVEAIHLSVA